MAVLTTLTTDTLSAMSETASPASTASADPNPRRGRQKAGEAVSGASRELRVPVVEAFGPTVQGEGPLAGTPTCFLRVAGCDYRCSWCDSPHAVLPELWSRSAPRLTLAEIRERLAPIMAPGGWLTISGGNPAMYELGPLVHQLHHDGYRIAVETQGSKWKPWLMWVDQLIISPKPPSAETGGGVADFKRFHDSCVRSGRHGIGTAVKVVVFDYVDLSFAHEVFQVSRPGWRRYLSVGTVQGQADEPTKEQVLADYYKVAEWIKEDPRFVDVAVLPQLHVLLWGTARGV